MFTTIATTLILLSHISIIGVLIWYGLNKKTGDLYLNYLRPRARMLALFVGTAGTLGSLFFSYGIGFEACILCLIQRFTLIGATILLAIPGGFTKKGAITLLVIGTLVALYHTILQYFPELESTSLCNAIGGISCVMRHIFAYGYITIPVMSLTTFGGMVWLVWVSINQISTANRV